MLIYNILKSYFFKYHNSITWQIIIKGISKFFGDLLISGSWFSDKHLQSEIDFSAPIQSTALCPCLDGVWPNVMMITMKNFANKRYSSILFPLIFFYFVLLIKKLTKQQQNKLKEKSKLLVIILKTVLSHLSIFKI